MRKYVPTVITSALVVIPYGFVLFPRLFSEGLVNLTSLVIFTLVSILFILPFILIMLRIGQILYRKTLNILVGQG